MFGNYINTSELLMGQNRNHNGNLKPSEVEWWGENWISKLWDTVKVVVLQRENNRYTTYIYIHLKRRKIEY